MARSYGRNGGSLLAGLASAKSLLGALRSARVFDLSFTWNEQSPVLNLNPPYSFALNRTHKMTHEMFGQVPGSRVSWASEIMYFSGQHGAPTIDAIGHIGRDLKLHGGVDAVAATSTLGGIGANLGIDNFPVDLMLNRAVFLDVARALGKESLDDGYGITCEDLNNTAEAQGVTIKRGDYVIVRTGQMERCLAEKKWGGYAGGDAPGVKFENCYWCQEKQIAAICTDTWGVEVRPNETTEANQPWHWVVIPAMGLCMGEIFYLKELAEDCAADGVYEFFFCAPPLVISRGTGSPINPQAIK